MSHITGLCTLTFVLRNLKNNDIILQQRAKRYKFGCLNYGEVVPEWINAADRDRYDVFVPGYASTLEVNTPYRVHSIIGVLKLANGNHKIAVCIDLPGYDHTRACDEIQRFRTQYTRRMRIQGHFMWLLEDCEAMPSKAE